MERGLLLIGVVLLAALALAVLRVLLSPSVRTSTLLTEQGRGDPGVTRTTFLFANLALAMTFLLGVVEWGGDTMKLEALRNATAFFDGGLESSVLSGGAATAYVWVKLGGKFPRGRA